MPGLSVDHPGGPFRPAGVTSLPGTNFVIWRHVLREVGGWDEKALTEDAELTIRIYETGRYIGFVPRAVTWEQEPEKLGTWLRQRTRWARGHNYLSGQACPSPVCHETAGNCPGVALYPVPLLCCLRGDLLSDIFFILACFGLITIHAVGPYAHIWVLAFLLFILEVGIALSREEGEDSFTNLLTIVFMYFTYCQLWMVVVGRALIDDVGGSGVKRPGRRRNVLPR